MPVVHVCPLSRVPQTVAATGASHLVSLINDGTPVVRPVSIPVERHLFLGINDIIEPADGMIAPGEDHVRTLVEFVGGWDRRQPIVIHCYAGISRSTAAAFITLCALQPGVDEIDIAYRLRDASPTATPNARIVDFADGILRRKGRMTAAIRAIGRGETAFEGVPFAIPLGA
ncbi:MAG TPA: tyrosine phosphatase family protein [Bauldia sp.]|nr:tyrosine phosphatase family protein [Bauldia sp.]